MATPVFVGFVFLLLLNLYLIIKLKNLRKSCELLTKFILTIASDWANTKKELEKIKDKQSNDL